MTVLMIRKHISRHLALAPSAYFSLWLYLLRISLLYYAPLVVGFRGLHVIRAAISHFRRGERYAILELALAYTLSTPSFLNL